MAGAVGLQGRQKLRQNLVAKERPARRNEEKTRVGNDAPKALGRFAVLRQHDESADFGGPLYE